MPASLSPASLPRSNARAIGRRCALGLLLSCAIATGAATQTLAPVADQPTTDQPVYEAAVNDPFQRLNRASFGLGMALDRAVLGPIAHAYIAVAPASARARVDAVITNLGEPRTVLNDLAQGHARRAGTATSRFVINSSAGVLGLFDVADRMGLPYHRSDFGQTLGRYGAEPGPYLYLPVLGPMTVRDAAGRLVDIVTDPVTRVGGGHRTTFGATRRYVNLLNTRTKFDHSLRALDDATDPYASLRSTYLQHRSAVVREATGQVEVLPDF